MAKNPIENQDVDQDDTHKDDMDSLYWETTDNDVYSKKRIQKKEHDEIAALYKRIRDIEFRIQWHEKSKEGRNGLSKTFDQMKQTEQARLVDLKLEFDQRRAAYDERYGAF